MFIFKTKPERFVRRSAHLCSKGTPSRTTHTKIELTMPSLHLQRVGFYSMSTLKVKTIFQPMEFSKGAEILLFTRKNFTLKLNRNLALNAF